MTNASVSTLPTTMLQLQSTVHASRELSLELAEVPVPEPKPHEVLVRMRATPINPSDLGLLLATADPDSFVRDNDSKTSASLSADAVNGLRSRLDMPMTVGNEGAGEVVAVGSDVDPAILGAVVGTIGGAMYAEYRCLPLTSCLIMPSGVAPAEAASHFVNPMTVLGMIETMRSEGHTALVHTAAASNLGQMLVKACLIDNIQLVNIVRRPEHVTLLHGLGATHVCDSSQPTFEGELTAALTETGATIAFDATGGGSLAGTIIACMEAAANARSTTFSRYGSDIHKQVYLYGGLDTRPLELQRGKYGMAWGVGGWLLTPFLMKSKPEQVAALRQRVANGITTEFSSHYTRHISLHETIDPAIINLYAAKSTGEKYLICP